MPDRYDELTKGAFNTWKSVDIQAALNAPSFEKGVVSILETAGVPSAGLPERNRGRTTGLTFSATSPAA